MASWQSAVDARAAQGYSIGQQWYDQQGPVFKQNNSAEAVARYAASKGYGLGDAWKQYASTPQQQPQTQKQQIKEADNLKQALRIAGSDGNVGNQELQRITKQFDVDASKAVRQLDQLNAGLKDRGKDLKIGLGSNAVNYIVKNQPSGWAFDQLMGKNTYGDGRIGQSITNYRNAAYTMNPGEGMTLGSWDERAKAQSAAGLIPLQRGGAYQINSAGGYSPKVSNAAFSNPVPRPSSVTPATTPGDTGGTGTTGTETPAANPIDALPDEPGMPSMQSANNAALNGNAGGFRARRSSWKSSGKTSKGTNNLKINNSGGVGLNIRG
jgi:hypothetical protein